MMPPYMSVKVRYTTTPCTTRPTLYKECVGSLTSPDFLLHVYYYRPYPRRLESQTICRCYYKGSTFSSVI